ncbi:MAG: hypothetical protein RIC55_05870 [Pirellulaceae bacterium]
MTDEKLSNPPNVEPSQPGIRHGCAAAGILALSIVMTLLVSPADPVSRLLAVAVSTALLTGVYMLGVWNGRP